MSLVTGLVLLAFCILMQGFFSGSEMAMVSANRAKLEQSANDGSSGAALAIQLLDSPDQLLGTCLIGTNLCLVSSGTIVALILRGQGYPQEWMVTIVLTPIVLMFGEALPKTLYAHYSETLAPLAARPLRIAQWLFTAPLWAVHHWDTLLQRLPGEAPVLQRKTLVELLDSSTDAGDIAPEDRALIRRLFAMRDTPVESCMTPLVDIIALPEDASVKDAVELVVRHGKSRVPIFRKRIDNIIGVVSHRDLLFRAQSPGQPVRSLMSDVHYVPETMPASELLRELRGKSPHMAVVVDEYGGATGLVTLEDLLEEVVGEIRDERDKLGPRIRRLGNRDWRVPARIEMDELSEALKLELPEGDYETVAGLLLAHLGRIPRAGEVVQIEHLTFHIEEANGRAIQTVRMTVPAPPTSS